MANIMMTDVCNLHCPYCFANEFVNKERNEISDEAFQKAVDFILGDASHSSVGLIGGEPTTHAHFDALMRKLLLDNRAKAVVVYTNGILIDRFWDVICHPKTHLLINCNPPQDIGEKNFQKLSDNLHILINQKLCKDRVTLGINMYRPDFEYDYLLRLLKEFSFNHVRVSITVPNLEDDRNMDARVYFEEMKPRMFEFFHALFKHNIIPNFDCNKIPSCLIKEKELEAFRPYLQNSFIAQHIGKSNVASTEVHCNPVIDIRQDLTAVRCFGLSSCTKQNIENFTGIHELQNYYLREIDAYAYNTVYNHKCVDCHLRQVMKCSGGCLAYKINEIKALSDTAKQFMRKYEA